MSATRHGRLLPVTGVRLLGVRHCCLLGVRHLRAYLMFIICALTWCPPSLPGVRHLVAWFPRAHISVTGVRLLGVRHCCLLGARHLRAYLVSDIMMPARMSVTTKPALRWSPTCA
jgi:hypothetical protein